MVYTSDDPIVAKQLEDIGCVAKCGVVTFGEKQTRNHAALFLLLAIMLFIGELGLALYGCFVIRPDWLRYGHPKPMELTNHY